MLFKSGIYSMILLIARLGVTVSSGSTDGTYEKNCTKIFKMQQTVYVAEYYQYSTCSGFEVWKRCKYEHRSRKKTVLRSAYRYGYWLVCCPNFIEVNNTCIKDCNEGWYGLNCSFPCNCTSSQTCNPVSGDCTCKPGRKGQDCKQDCICKQPGTSNCDDQRQTCNCSDELRDGACSSANLTAVEQIRSFMTTICNCQIDDAFCVPTNESCHCKNGWTGDQCEIALLKKTFSFGYIIGGVAGFLVLIVLVVVVIAVFFCKRRQRTNDASTVVVYETPNASRNVYYSHLSSNLHKNENVGGNETNTEHHVAIIPSGSIDDASGSQYKNTIGGLQYKEDRKAQYEEVEYVQN